MHKLLRRARRARPDRIPSTVVPLTSQVRKRALLLCTLSLSLSLERYTAWNFLSYAKEYLAQSHDQNSRCSQWIGPCCYN